METNCNSASTVGQSDASPRGGLDVGRQMLAAVVGGSSGCGIHTCPVRPAHVSVADAQAVSNAAGLLGVQMCNRSSSMKAFASA